MGRSFEMNDYVDVADRIREFREAHPTGCLRPANPDQPYRIETIGDRVFVVYAAAAYRTPDDPMPGIGVAWEAFPGRTPYTKDSELMNAETSAWGRALVAVLAADTKRGIATRQEVDARREAPPPAAAPAPRNGGRRQDRTTPPAPPAATGDWSAVAGQDVLGALWDDTLHVTANTKAARLDYIRRAAGRDTLDRLGELTPQEADLVRATIDEDKAAITAGVGS